MSAIITDALRVETAKALRDYITETDNTVYMYLGKDSAWPGEDTLAPVNNLANIHQASDDIIIMKRLLAGNVTHVINRYDWTSGRVFAQYDTSDSDLNSNNKAYYCITSALNVYKCLNNNFSNPSTKEPVGTSINPFTLSDDYTWKYMYTVAKQTADEFMTDQFIPVKSKAAQSENQWLVQASAISGSIDSYIVKTRGAGYTSANVTIVGDGSGATGIPIIRQGEIVGIAVSNSGSGYTFAECVITGNGVGASVFAQVAPVGGHGADPVYELGGHYIMVQSRFGQESYPTVPDIFSFRKLGLISAPLDMTSLPFTNFIAGGCYKIYSSTVGFEAGNYIKFSNSKTARIVNIGADFTGSFMLLSESPEILVDDTFIKDGDSGVTGKVLSLIQPDTKKNSGRVLYTEHRAPIVKNENQTEFVRITIEF